MHLEYVIFEKSAILPGPECINDFPIPSIISNAPHHKAINISYI